MDDRRGAFASDGTVRALCLKCGRSWPVEATSCLVCGVDLDGSTARESVHSAETVLLEPDDTRQTAAQAASSDEYDASATDEMPREPSAPALPTPSTGSSSDPPTRFLRGYDEHIELPPGSVVDDFEIDTKLGEGAMGVVYAARHLALGKRVAIKVIAPRLGADSQAMARFEREARTVAQLHHPGIVDVTGFGTLADGRSYLVMEYLRGEGLDDRLERGQPPLDEALNILDQIARALEVAHGQGVVHRDLKPANIFLSRVPGEHRAIVKLLDFGLAKLATEADRRVEKTASNIVIGTAMYISPEQARGPDVDGRSDVYALGCMAYELVLGTVPFPDAKTVTALIAAHLGETPPRPRSIWPSIPAALDLLLFGLLAKDPNYRPTLAQVRHAISSARSPTIGDRRAATLLVAGDRGRAIVRAKAAAFGAIAMLVGIAIGAATRGSQPGVEQRSVEHVDAGSSGPVITPIAIDAGAAKAVEPVIPAPTTDLSPGSAAPRVTDATQTVAHPRPLPPRPIGSGVLRIVATPNCDIVIDGKATGLRTPQVEIKLPAGRHKITLVNGARGIKYTFPIDIKANQVDTEIKDLRDHPDP